MAERADVLAQRIASEHRVPTIAAFTGQWQQVRPHVELGATAAEQVAAAVDAVGEAVLSTKTAIVDVLDSGNRQQRQIRENAVSAAAVGPLIAALLRLLGTYLRPLLSRLLGVVRKALSGLLSGIKRAFQTIVDFFTTLFGDDVDEPDPVPREQSPEPQPLPEPEREPVYRRDEPLPPAEELIANGEEYTNPGKRTRRLPEKADPNSVLYTRSPPHNGPIRSYAVYSDEGLVIKRVDLAGRPHGDMPAPHVIYYKRNEAPDGTVRATPREDSIRPAYPEEIP